VISFLEHVGAATWDESIKSLKAAGTLVTCGAKHRTEGRTRSPFPIFSRQLSLIGSYMGTMSELHEVLGHVFCRTPQAGDDHIFPLKDIVALDEYMEKSQMFLQIVLNP